MLSTKRIQILLATVAIISAIFGTACKKEAIQTSSVKTDAQNVELAQKSLQASLFFTSSFSQATNAATKVNGLRQEEVLQVRGACTPPIVYPLDLLTFPKTVTNNYGAGCTDTDGKLKTGKLTLTVGKIWETGSTIKAAFDNYSEDSVKLVGSYTITNNGSLGVNNLTFVAENITVTDKTGKNISYNIRQTHKQIAGTYNLDPLDDVYEVSTVMSATLPDGTKFNWENTTPLKKTNLCWWIQKGTGILKLNDVPMTVDFGSDTCDNDATVTLNGVVYKVKL
jgi:hypothetical protein